MDLLPQQRHTLERETARLRDTIAFLERYALPQPHPKPTVAVLAAMLSATVRRLPHVLRLIEARALPEASILVRSLMELAVSSLYIALGAEKRERRAYWFLAHEWRLAVGEVETVHRFMSEEIDDEFRAIKKDTLETWAEVLKDFPELAEKGR